MSAPIPAPDTPQGPSLDTPAQVTQAQAAADSAVHTQARELASLLAVPDATTCQLVKGVVTAVSTWTLSAQIGGDTSTTVDSIRYFLPYAPVIGDVIQIIKQGSDLVTIGKVDNSTDSAARAADAAAIATENAWTTPTLASGFTNSSDTIKYRAWTQRGEKYLEIRGSCTIGSPTYTSNVATVFTLAAGFRPALNSSILIPRDSGGIALKVNFLSSGVVQIDNLKGVRTDADNATSATTTVDMQHFHDDLNANPVGGGNTATGFAKYGTWGGAGGTGTWFNGFPGGNPHSHLIPIHDHGMANTLPTSMWFTGTTIIL
jgi:hypothetical protein